MILPRPKQPLNNTTVTSPFSDTADYSVEDPSLSWQPLAYFNLFRLLLSGALVLMANWGLLLKPLGSFNPNLFVTAAGIYLVVAVVAVVTQWFRRPGFLTQAVGFLFIDLAVTLVLMHSSGGTGSGLGILLMVYVAAAGLLLPRELTLLLTALATLGLLAEQARWWLSNAVIPADFTRAGLLGIGLFATAAIAYELARRSRVNAKLAADRGEELKNLARLNEEIIQRMQTGVIAVTREGTIQLANKAARDYTSSALAAGTLLLDCAPTVASQYERWVQTQTQPPLKAGEKIRTNIGESSADEKKPGSTLIFLEDASAAAQQAQLMKMASLGTLTASIAHEIRNPLAAISTAGELLRETDNLAEQTVALAEIIDRHGSRLNRIVEEILEMGKIKPFDPQTVALGDWFSQFTQDFCLTHGLDQEALALEVAPGLTITFDTNQLHQVVWNITENALQHCNRAHPFPWISITADYGYPTNQVVINITDQGPGVPADQLEELFTPFFTERDGGTGLGLYIARELCSANQANLACTTVAPEGARFTITVANSSP